ncbi:MAG: Bax protein [Candidatus Azotimanducaceae bacterium]|jgi:Bax protein
MFVSILGEGSLESITRSRQKIGWSLFFCGLIGITGCTESAKNKLGLNGESDDGNLVLPEAPSSKRASIPDFASMVDVKVKKQKFFDYLHSRTRKSNDRIWAEREYVLNFRESFDQSNVTDQQLADFATLVDRYGLELPEQPDDVFFKSLLERVDVVPASLVLAQGANESGWGTSRFAREGHNFFGIWCYSEGCGLKPESRTFGAKHEVRKFRTVQESVSFYLHNINIGHAYEELRGIRAQLREDEERLSGVYLSEGLIRYSERGTAYIKEIKELISQNDLGRFNTHRAESGYSD